MKFNEIVITHALRTPIGKFQGALGSLTAVQLGTHAVEAVLKQSAIDKKLVGQVIMGHGRQAGNGPNSARQVTLRAGLPESTIAYTINMACASGLKAIVLAAQAIADGECEVAIAGGMESMTNVPFMLSSDARQGWRMGHHEIADLMYRDGFHCPLADQLMGRTAETLRMQYNISRAEQDEFAAWSHNKAEQALKAGKFKDEIAPITLKDKKGDIVFDKDEGVREGCTAEQMGKLKPVFMDDGTVHPGNASGITDGGSAVLLMSAEKAAALGYKPLARLEGFAFAGVDPKIMGIGPVPATRALNKQLGIEMNA